MSAPLTTPSPYLRDGLLSLVADLRARAEQAVQAQADADAEVARLREELANAEDHARACAAEVTVIAESIQWAEARITEFSRLVDASPAQQLAETGLMRETPDPPDGGLPFNVVQAPDDVVAALTGGVPAVPPPVPDDPSSEPGTLVATHGPGETGPLDPAVTTPDPGLAHPVPNPPTPPAAPPGDGGGRHARPKGSRRTGGWPLIRRKDDEQDGDRTDG